MKLLEKYNIILGRHVLRRICFEGYTPCTLC